MQSMTEVEHGKALLSIEEDIFRARMALMAGQPDAYKAKLMSAHISLQVLMKREVA